MTIEYKKWTDEEIEMHIKNGKNENYKIHPLTYNVLARCQYTYLLGYHCYKISSWLCKHKNTDIRYKIFKNKRGLYKIYINQCTDCGRHLGRVGKDKISCDESLCQEYDWELDVFYSDIMWYDIMDLTGYYVKLKNRSQIATDIITNKIIKYPKQHWYHKYLKSPQWKYKHDLIIERCNRLCEICKIDTATQVHHLHYKTIFNENLEDLIGICDNCHNLEHADWNTDIEYSYLPCEAFP